MRSRQNRDGGWAYRSGRSNTEATALALLALSAAGELDGRVVDRGVAWLRGLQRNDGGWAPNSEVSTSTWVSATVLLLPRRLAERLDWQAGLKWLLLTTGRETGLLQRIRTTMITGRLESAQPDGWPFFPETAAWVTPTAISMLALRKAQGRVHRDDVARRIQAGQDYLISRRCSDGGWNHGSSRALGYEAPSYPETTGLALASLKDIPSSLIENSLVAAETHLRNCRSLEAARWLELGLLAHGRRFVSPKFDSSRTRLTQELALHLIADAASRGRNALVED